MKINVILRNITPIFSATPGSDSISLDGTFNPPGGGFPLIRTRKLNIPASVGDGVVKVVPLPVVPGNTMRNLLRRSILKNIVFPHFQGREQLSIGAYAAVCAGNATGNPNGVATFDDIVNTRKNVFLGLFGGGPRMMQGRLSVDSLYPIHKNAARVIGNGYEERMLGGNITDIVWQRRVDPILKINEEDAQEVIKDGRQALTQWALDALKASAAKAGKREKKTAAADAAADAEESSASTPRGLNAFNAHEVVIPGIDWLLRIELDNPTDAQVGLVLAGIAKMANMAIAGGNSKGYGRFKIEDVTLDGECIWAGESYSDNEQVTRYYDAMAEELEALGAQPFEDFIASSASEVEK